MIQRMNEEDTTLYFASRLAPLTRPRPLLPEAFDQMLRDRMSKLNLTTNAGQPNPPIGRLFVDRIDGHITVFDRFADDRSILLLEQLFAARKYTRFGNG